MTDVSPRHRAVKHRAPRPRLVSRRTLAALAVGGVVATGGVVGVQAFGGSSADPVDAAGEAPVATRLSVDSDVSRSGDRAPLSAVQEAADIARSSAERAEEAEKDAADKKAAADEKAADQKKKDDAAAAKQEQLEEARNNPKDVARAMLADYGFDAGQFSCLDSLWAGESGWDYTATNPSSGAYGIPQSLPATKMATAGADWETNPVTQIKWGLGYIRDAYGTPCSADSFKAGNGFY